MQIHSPCKTTRPVFPGFNEEGGDGNEILIDNSDLHVLDYSPSLRMLCIICVVENKLDLSPLPRHIRMDIKMMTMPNHISRPINQSG